MTINLQNITKESDLEQLKPYLKLKFYGYRTCFIKDSLDNLNTINNLLLEAESFQEDREENIFSEDFDSLDDELTNFIQTHRFLACIDFRTLHYVNLIKKD